MYALPRVAVAAVMILSPSYPGSLRRAVSEVTDNPEPPSISVSLQVDTLRLEAITVGPALVSPEPSPSTRVMASETVQNAPRTTVAKETYDSSSIKSLAQELCDNTFGTGQFQYLDLIVRSESGWNPRAREPTSGAYGLGQALPASKMAPYGSDYLTNPETQLRWLMGYIAGRYGTPEKAWGFHLAHHWY